MNNFINTLLNSAEWLPLTLMIIGLVVVAVSIFFKLREMIVGKKKLGKALFGSKIWLNIVWYLTMAVMLVVGFCMSHSYEQVPASSDKLNHLLSTTDAYLVGDYGNGCYYEIPSQLVELPIEVNVYSLDLEPMGTVTLEDWNNLPVTIDDLWYYYGTQETKDLFLQTTDNPMNYCMTFVYRPETQVEDPENPDAICLEKTVNNVYTICFPQTNTDVRPYLGQIILYCCIALLLWKIWSDLLENKERKLSAERN